MFGYSDRIKKLEKENAELRAKLSDADEFIGQFNNEVEAATPLIDFDNLRVFSIERLIDNNRPTTVIGYWKAEPVVVGDEVVGSKDKVSQWYLFCNNERHEELVTQFKEWKVVQNGQSRLCVYMFVVGDRSQYQTSSADDWPRNLVVDKINSLQHDVCCYRICSSIWICYPLLKGTL